MRNDAVYDQRQHEEDEEESAGHAATVLALDGADRTRGIQGCDVLACQLCTRGQTLAPRTEEDVDMVAHRGRRLPDILLTAPSSSSSCRVEVRNDVLSLVLCGEKQTTYVTGTVPFAFAHASNTWSGVAPSRALICSSGLSRVPPGWVTTGLRGRLW